jgi:hypothetical protein
MIKLDLRAELEGISQTKYEEKHGNVTEKHQGHITGPGKMTWHEIILKN